MSKIAVAGNASGTGTLTIAAPNTNSDRTLTLPDVTATVITDSAGVLNIGSGQVYKDGSGNVGIGTSSPGYKLDVKGGNGDQLNLNNAGQPYTQLNFQNNGNLKSAVWYNDTASMFAVYSSASVGLFSGGNSSTPKATLDSSGNLGLAVTPSAWRSGDKAIQVGSVASLNTDSNVTTDVGYNYFYNSSDVAIYSTTAQASRYSQYLGAHRFFTAPSGTAGNAISFTQAMTLDASGNLIVGGTSPFSSAAGRGNISITGSSSAILSMGTPGDQIGYLFHDGTNMNLFNDKSGYLRFATGGTERARIDSSGNLLVGGTTSPSGSGNLYVGTTAFIGTTNADPTVNRVTGMQVRSDGRIYTRAAGAWDMGLTGTSGAHMGFYTDNGARVSAGSISSDGSTTAYNTSSDYRLKEDWIAVADASNPCCTCPCQLCLEGLMAHE
jgi:hypothetical protein